MWIIDVRHDSAIPLEFTGITPDRLETLSSAEVAHLPILFGKNRVELGEFAKISRHTAEAITVFRGDTGRVKHVGAGMTRGTLAIEGDVGRHAGAGMTGGCLRIAGDAGDWLGAEMRDGEIAVAGKAGHNVGSAYRGSRHGMRGGTIEIEGGAGDELGLLMRRGSIAVGGTIGDFAGAAMIAGTIIGRSGFGPRAGAGMKRGTLISGAPTDPIAPGFRYSCEYAPAYLDLIPRRGWNWPASKSVQCYRGDALTGGRGELLVMAPA